MATDEARSAAEFDAERRRLRAAAYRILGSLDAADDAVQEAWLRLGKTDRDEIDDLPAWLTVVVVRICLNALRTRGRRAEQPLEVLPAEPIVSVEAGGDPEYEAIVADSVGFALQVVLEALPPLERVAFVLHDMFSVPFDEIAAIIDRSPAASRQLASRARRRVSAAPRPDPDRGHQRQAVDAYFAAAREGDLDALLAVLAPDVVLRNHRPGGAVRLDGAEQVSRGAVMAAGLAPSVRPAMVNGTVGGVAFDDEGDPFAILAFTVLRGRIAEIDVLNDRRLVPRLVRLTPPGSGR